MAERPNLDAPTGPSSPEVDADRADDAGTGSDAKGLLAENEQLREEIRTLREHPPARTGIGHRLRAIATPVLVILTSIALVGATVGVWFERTVWNTDRYVALVEPLADDPAVTNAIAAKLTTDVFEALDVRQRVSDALSAIPNLPPSAAFLTAPITAGAENIVRGQVERFLASDTFHNLWVDLNRTVHSKVVALLEGDYSQLPNVSVSGGEVQLNLVSAVARVIADVVQSGLEGLGINVTVPEIPANLDPSAAISRLGTALGVTLPPDFGQVTIMTESQLTTYQETAGALKKIGGALALATIVLVGLTLLVAVRRRRALIWLGLGGVVALFLGGVFLRRIGGRILDAVTAPAAHAAARDVFHQVGSSLRQAGIVVGVFAALVALVAYLAGRPRWLVAGMATVRRVTASREGGSELQVWVAAHADLTRIAAVVLAVVVLALTGIDWIPVAVVVALLGLVIWQVDLAQKRVGLPRATAES